MTLTTITLLTFASTSLLVVSLGLLAYDWMFRYRFDVQERLKELANPTDGDQTVHAPHRVAENGAEEKISSDPFSRWLL